MLVCVRVCMCVSMYIHLWEKERITLIKYTFLYYIGEILLEVHIISTLCMYPYAMVFPHIRFCIPYIYIYIYIYIYVYASHFIDIKA